MYSAVPEGWFSGCRHHLAGYVTSNMRSRFWRQLHPPHTGKEAVAEAGIEIRAQAAAIPGGRGTHSPACHFNPRLMGDAEPVARRLGVGHRPLDATEVPPEPPQRGTRFIQVQDTFQKCATNRKIMAEGALTLWPLPQTVPG